MDKQQKIKGDLNIFRTRLGMLENTDEKRRALEVTNDFLDAISKHDVSDFVLNAEGRRFIKEITILRGVTTHKIKLDTQSVALLEEIRDLIPAAYNEVNTIFMPWG
ncbi:hypothetical protein ABUE38_00255 [Pediococcus parvulus]|uniref:Uncharacterized protein n=1 Tax=Pediococcus parvulus TaxID=54062 RepID=A0AAP5TBJ4_9LACO|nr:hypothetical protein [Pediococcus parvulus]MDV7693991.1 hypothetical protein [Pediococcus parvulus]OAD63397.1 hypothetical protein A7K95_09650 [Pediococcus parvulus]